MATRLLVLSWFNLILSNYHPAEDTFDQLFAPPPLPVPGHCDATCPAPPLMENYLADLQCDIRLP